MEKYRRAGQASNDNIIRRMHFSCTITKATDTYSECVTLTAFPLQQWLQEHVLMLRYTYIAGLPITQFLKSGISYIWPQAPPQQ